MYLSYLAVDDCFGMGTVLMRSRPTVVLVRDRPRVPPRRTPTLAESCCLEVGTPIKSAAAVGAAKLRVPISQARVLSLLSIPGWAEDIDKLAIGVLLKVMAALLN